MAELTRPEICIIGAGALGIALAEHARRLGAVVTLVDRGRPETGDGPQQALRLAALRASAERAHLMRNAAAFGVGNGDAKVSMKAVQDRALGLVREAAPLSSHDRLTALGIDIVRGATRFSDAGTVLVGDIELKPKSIVLATGSVPTVPDIPGLDQVGAFTSDTILGNSRKLTHLLVIGGDASAYALAQVFARLGSQVTLVPQGKALSGFDGESVAILLAALAAEGVRVLDSGVVREIVPRAQGIGAIVALASGDDEALDLSHVLVADGRSPDIAELDPEAAKIRLNGGHYGIGASGQTSNRRIRAVGPAAGIVQWQQALSHGKFVISALAGAPSRYNSQTQPRLVPTDPALAEVGHVPAASDRAKPGHRLFRASFVENGQAMVAGAGPGLAKVVLTAKGQIAGASLVGPSAAELASVLALAMERGMALTELANLSLPDPSLMAVLVRLAESAAAERPVSAWAQRQRALRRLLPS